MNYALLQRLHTFFDNKGYLKSIVLPIVQRRRRVSLRLLDWLCTNYSKTHHVTYTTKVQNEVVCIDVYDEYRRALASHKKSRFDPFCRRERIDFSDGATTIKNTTIGQLNFFMFAIRTKLVRYAEANASAIYQHMIHTHASKHASKTTSTTKQKQARKALTEKKKGVMCMQAHGSFRCTFN